MSLKCDNRIFNSVINQKLSVHHDTFGMPIIKGGTFDEAWEAVGYETAKIRLWDIVSSVMSLLGRSAELTGSGDLFGDEFIRIIRPSVKLVDHTIKKLKNKTVRLYTAYVRGLNRRIQEVNNNDALLPMEFVALNEIFQFRLPIPIIDPKEFISTVMIVGLLRAINESFTQLDLFSELNTLVLGFGFTNGYKIFNDLMPKQGILNRMYTVLESYESKCIDYDHHNIPDENEYYRNALSSSSSLSTLNSNKYRKVLSRFRGILSDGSYGLVISPDKSVTKNPLLFGGNHDPVGVIPSIYYEYVIDSVEAGQMYVRTSNHLPFFFNTISKDVAFLFVRSLTSTSSLYVESIENRVLDRIDTILIRQIGGGFNTQQVSIFRSKNVGIVLESSGTQILVFRNPNLFEYVEPTEIITNIQFSKSVSDIDGLLRGKYPTSLFALSIAGTDRCGNIFACDLARPLIWPKKVDSRIPQGIIGPAYYFSVKDTIETPFNVNPKQGFFAIWNDPLLNEISIPYSGLNGPVPISRGYYISDYAKSISHFTFRDIRYTWKHIAITNALNGDSNSLFYNADFFVPIFKKKFFDIIKKSDKKSIIDFLSDYNGNWLFPDNLVSGNDINSQWILANVWILRAAYVIMEPYADKLGIFAPFNPTQNNLYPEIPSVSFIGSLSVFLLARILGVQKTGFPEFDWLGKRNINEIVIDALDYSLKIIGPGFQGIDKRPTTQIDVEFINSGGFEFFVEPIRRIPGTETPFYAANIPAAIMILEMGNSGPENLETILPTGVSGNLFSQNPPINPPPVPAETVLGPNTLDQSPLFWHYVARPL